MTKYGHERSDLFLKDRQKRVSYSLFWPNQTSWINAWYYRRVLRKKKTFFFGGGGGLDILHAFWLNNKVSGGYSIFGLKSRKMIDIIDVFERKSTQGGGVYWATNLGEKSTFGNILAIKNKSVGNICYFFGIMKKKNTR